MFVVFVLYSVHVSEKCTYMYLAVGVVPVLTSWCLGQLRKNILKVISDCYCVEISLFSLLVIDGHVSECLHLYQTTL